MKIGSELIAKVILRANAELPKIKRILIDAYRDLKPRVLASLKELQRLVRKNVKALKESRLFQTPKPPKW